MKFKQYIKNRKESFRQCNCGEDHLIRIIQGMFHYAEDNNVAFCVALIDHQNEKHVWVSFITGEWPNTNHKDCYVSSHIWSNEEDRIMKIKDSSSSPFKSEDVFDCFPVSREQVLAVDGAKEWFITTYLDLFAIDKEIGGFIEHAA